MTDTEKFLRELGHETRLVVINPQAGEGEVHIKSAPFTLDKIDKALAWIDSANKAGWNVYWTPNKVRDGFTGNKAAEADIVEARYVWADIDPDIKSHGTYGAARKALTDYANDFASFNGCTYDIDSGNGRQLFWRIDGKFSNTDLRDIGKRLNIGEVDVGDLGRIMRVPGTLNWPDKAKLRKGYSVEPVQGRLVSSSPKTFGEFDLSLICDWAQDSQGSYGRSAYVEEAAPVCDELVALAKAQPLDLTDDAVQELLAKLPCEDGNWFTVCQALHHQYGGSETGWQMLDEWSKLDEEAYDKAKNRVRWNSLGKKTGVNPVTMASVIKAVGVAKSPDEVRKTFEALRDEASEVHTTDDYAAFKRKVQSIGKRDLPDDLRAMLASVLFENSGLGLNKSELKKALAVPKGGVGSTVDMAPDWVKDWAFMTDKDTFRNLDNGVETSKVGFHAAFGRLMPVRETGERYNAAQWALEKWLVPVCDRRMYLPMHQDKMIVVDGVNTLNLFNVGTLPEIPEVLSDAERETLAMIDEHMRRLFPNDRDRALITSFMAFQVQQMGRKVRWAPVVTNTIQGDGKSMIASFVAAALGHENVQTINGRQLEEQYSPWAHGHMLVAVEEVKFEGESAFTILNNFKTYITNDTVSVRQMYMDTYNVPNITNYILFSNYTYSIPVKKDDRRYCMFRSPVTQAQILELQARGFYAKLWDGIRAHGGAIRKWLMEYSICAEFLPDGVAPMTDAKRDVIAVNEESGAGLEDLIADGHWGVTEDVIAVGELRKAMGLDGDAYMKRGYVKNVLSEHGYRPATWLNADYKVRLKGKTERIWAKKTIHSGEIVAHFDADFNEKLGRKLDA
jgi:hypothetical protein